jgi:hypothetical protein
MPARTIDESQWRKPTRHNAIRNALPAPPSIALSSMGKLGMSFSPDTTGGRIAIESSARPGRVYGFGVSYQATARLELRAQSERYTGLWQTPSGELEANALTFGARMRF